MTGFIKDIPEEAVLNFHIEHSDSPIFSTLEQAYVANDVSLVGYIETDVDPENLITLKVGDKNYVPVRRYSSIGETRMIAFRPTTKSESPDLYVFLDSVQESKLQYGFWKLVVNEENVPFSSALAARSQLFVRRLMPRLEVLD